MEKLAIIGGTALDGDITVSGSKNAALPILTAALLSEGDVHISNVPHLRDVTTTIELLGRMGADVTLHDAMDVEVSAREITEFTAPYDLVKTMRASVPCWSPDGRQFAFMQYGKIAE